VSTMATTSQPVLRLVRRIVVRIASVGVLLLAISFLTFSLLYLAPGDLVKNLLGNRPSSPEAIAAIRLQYQLDEPFMARYVSWLGSALRGDLGMSIRMQQPVSDVIASRMDVTLSLIGLSFLVAVLVALPLGVASAARSGQRLDRLASGFSLLGLSSPSFALAILAITVFSLMIPLFPAFGAGEPGLSRLWHLVLPSAVLAAGIGAILMRMTRAAMLRELEGDSVTFARARGLSENTVRHIALRSALIPIVTSAGLILTFIIGGTIIVETVFALPGMGQLLAASVFFKDLPVVQAVTLLVATAIASITILVDLSYLILDPRVRAREFSS
jgi:peptide/nickel transport system permease protein